MKIAIKSILLLILGIVFIKINADSQPPPNPPTFRNLTLEGTGSNTHFKLDWTMNSGDTNDITKFKIYKANIFTNNYLLCSYYQTINRYGTDTAWTVNANPLYTGNYTFYITAIKKFGLIEYESIASNLLQARFKQGHVDVTFTTAPPTIGSVATLYQYNANATSPDTAPVNYFLKVKPLSMTVVGLTGQVQWIPIATGRYNVTLNAYLNFNPVGLADKGKSDGTLSDEILIDTSDCDKDQSWLLLVKSCSNPTYFSGIVVDENRDTIRSGLVTAHSANNLDIDSVYYGLIGNDGSYRVEVLEGAYKLSIEGGSFTKEWYNDKLTMDAADSIIGPCGTNTRLNWVVKKNPPDTITFAYEPNLVELLGNEYVYNGAAMSSSGRELRYTLDTAPQGMIVDPITGLIKWTPSNIGRFYVSLKAYLLDDSLNSFAYKNFYIKVKSCVEETIIKGNVKDGSGNIIKQGNIEIYNDSGIDSLGIYFGRIGEDGTYLVKIDEGNCKVFVDGEGFISQWYDNKPSNDSAIAVPCPCGDTTEINLIVERIPPQNLTITSTPSNSTVTGSLYNYNPVVTGNGKRVLRYLLINKPVDMTIDEKTGEIRWTPKDVGGYKVKLKAYLLTDSVNSFVIQEWWIKVRSCTTDTYISGNVIDENNNSVPTGSVKIVSVSGMDSLGYYTGSIINGNYRVLVDEGKCRVYVEGPTFRGEWYEDKTSEQTATIIDAPCGETTTVNLSVNLFRNYSVSGKVIDELNSNPIENATVYFQSIDSIDSTSTNQSGDYAIDLNEKYSYTSWANVPQNPMYVIQYFSGTGNITEATPVEFTGDINNINFALKIAPLSSNRMFGKVETVDGEPIKSIVLNLTVFPADSNIASMFDARTFITGISGNYEFQNLAEGDYLLLAIPDRDKYVPGYFKKDATAVPSWVDGTLVKIVSGEQSGPHIISLPFGVPTTGNGSIFGSITGDELPAFLKPGDSPLAKEAVSGAVVITVSNDEKVRKYNISTSKGVYKLDSLEAGDYHVNIDKLGYGHYSFDITIDPDNQPHNVDAELSIQIPVGVLDEIKSINNQVSIFPNPSEGHFIIQSEIDLSRTDISLTNLYGQTIIVENNDLSNNPYNFKIRVDNVSQGLYFLKFMKNGKSFVKPVVIVK